MKLGTDTENTKELFTKLMKTRSYNLIDFSSNMPGVYFKFSAKGLSPGWIIYVEMRDGEEYFELLEVV